MFSVSAFDHSPTCGSDKNRTTLLVRAARKSDIVSGETSSVTSRVNGDTPDEGVQPVSGNNIARTTSLPPRYVRHHSHGRTNEILSIQHGWKPRSKRAGDDRRDRRRK